jgi:small GTP-binding protein
MNFFKVLVIGNVSSGKTSLANRIVNDTFTENYKPTLGCEFALKVIDLEGVSIRVQLWDLAGQDRLGGISKLYCRDANGALVVCDITVPSSVERAIDWKRQVDEIVRQSDGQEIPVVLCVNKHDLVQDKTMDDLDALVTRHSFSAAYFTSAKTGLNAAEAFSHLTREILHRKPKVEVRTSGASKLGSVASPKQSKRKCC